MVIERETGPITREYAIPVLEQRAFYNCLHGFTHFEEGHRFSRYSSHRGLSLTPGFTTYLKDISGMSYENVHDVLIPALAKATLEDGQIPDLVLPSAHVEDVMTLLMKAHHLEGVGRRIFPQSNPKKKYEVPRGKLMSESGLLELHTYLVDTNSILFTLGRSIDSEERKKIDSIAKKITHSHIFNPSIHNVAMEGRGKPRTHSVGSLALFLQRTMQLRCEQSFSKQAHFDFAFS